MTERIPSGLHLNLALSRILGLRNQGVRNPVTIYVKIFSFSVVTFSSRFVFFSDFF